MEGKITVSEYECASGSDKGHEAINGGGATAHDPKVSSNVGLTSPTGFKF
jgi:hypothetical protein